MKIALVHDQLNDFGGAERVLLTMSEMWPEAPIYTAFYKEGSPAWERFKGKDIRVSRMQSISFLASPLRFLAPKIWNSFDFSQYDVIIGSASWFITKGFTGKGNALEICYCHTPPRWLYGYATARKQNALIRLYGTIVGFFMRQYDFTAAQRVNYFIANSVETKKRIEKFYRRDSTVIYPPIGISKGETLHTQGLTLKKREYYLVVSRLAQAKNVEQAILAANKLNIPLKIAGTGPDEARLRELAGSTVEFLGFVPDEKLGALYAGAKAFLALATDEDFGMTPVEALGCGTPVIAYKGGGYIESVIDGKTGIFFNDDLVSAIQRFNTIKFNSADCIAQAKKFSKNRFQKELKAFVKTKYESNS